MDPSPNCFLPRARLLHVLDGAEPFALITGPAGAGKSLLLDQWCAEQPEATLCRIVLEDDETLLWQPILRSLSEHGLPLRNLSRRLGRSQLLGSQLSDELERVIAASGRQWTVVVDGFELTSRALAGEVETLLVDLAGVLRFVLSTRVDPAMRLYRSRLEGTLTEIRAADLAFTDDEAAMLLARCGTPLPSEQVHTLNARWDGWVTGLLIAARELAHEVEPANLVAALVAADVDMHEYLLHEILDVQEPETRDLVLCMSVPDVLTLDLAEELAGEEGLRHFGPLVRSNMFLDWADERSLRYAPFFRDLLRAQLLREDPLRAARLHRQAANWYRAHEQWEQASVQLAGGALWEELAEQLVDDLLVPRLLVGDKDRLWNAAHRIPIDLGSPSACLVRASMALASGEAARCAHHLRQARDALAGSRGASAAWSWSEALVTAVYSAESGPAGAGQDAVQRCARTRSAALGPAERMVSPEVDGLLQVASARLALRRGELGHALALLARAVALPGLPIRLRADVVADRALVQALTGRLSLACESAQESLAIAGALRLAADGRNPAAYLALALVALERSDLPAVSEHLAGARVCRRFASDPVSRVVVVGTTAHLDAGDGPRDHQASVDDSLDPCEDVQDPWLLGWLRLQTAEAAIAGGREDEALEVLEPLTRDGESQARLATAVAYAEQGRTVALSRTLAHAPLHDPNPVAQVKRLLVQAVHEANHHSLRAASPLVEESLEVASQEGIRRPFLSASPAIGRVLAAHHELLERHQWLHEDLSLPVRPVDGHRDRSPRQQAVATTGGSAAGPIEPLTPKELEVLGHLDELLTTTEIAQKMFVSVNTVRTHIRNILRKLEVHRRNGAVRRARELALLDPSPAFTQQG